MQKPIRITVTRHEETTDGELTIDVDCMPQAFEDRVTYRAEWTINYDAQTSGGEQVGYKYESYWYDTPEAIAAVCLTNGFDFFRNVEFDYLPGVPEI
jgi:hypothetical protein